MCFQEFFPAIRPNTQSVSVHVCASRFNVLSHASLQILRYMLLSQNSSVFVIPTHTHTDTNRHTHANRLVHVYWHPRGGKTAPFKKQVGWKSCGKFLSEKLFWDLISKRAHVWTGRVPKSSFPQSGTAKAHINWQNSYRPTQVRRRHTHTHTLPKRANKVRATAKHSSYLAWAGSSTRMPMTQRSTYVSVHVVADNPTQTSGCVHIRTVHFVPKETIVPNQIAHFSWGCFVFSRWITAKRDKARTLAGGYCRDNNSKKMSCVLTWCGKEVQFHIWAEEHISPTLGAALEKVILRNIWRKE